MKKEEIKKVFLILIFLLSLFSCTNDVLSTGLEGTVYRGPISPVVIEGQVNDAPFSALFHVYNSKNKKVKSFTSNEQGTFSVLLAPGNYTIKPDQSAPIISGEFQTKSIIVNSISITQQDLYFDTGIR